MLLMISKKRKRIYNKLSIDNKELFEKIFNLYDNAKNTNKYYFNIELKFMVDGNYMKSQSEINEDMRFRLIEWIIQVHLKFDLHPNTLYLTINMIDRYLEKVNIKKKKFGLLGVTCMFIAGKYEEKKFPSYSDYVLVTAHRYSKKQILNMEKKVLNILNFSLTTPSSLYFLEMFKEFMQIDDYNYYLCCYILELSLLYFIMNKFKPSIIASGSLLITNLLMYKENMHINTMKKHINNISSELIECVIYQINFINEASDKDHHVFKKYKLSKYNNISSICISDEKIQLLKSLL